MPFLLGVGEGEPPDKFSKREDVGLDRTLIFKRGMTFLREEVGGCCFYIKNKLKSEILNDKKVYKQNVFL